jgi:hypothetical protein
MDESVRVNTSLSDILENRHRAVLNQPFDDAESKREISDESWQRALKHVGGGRAGTVRERKTLNDVVQQGTGI